MTRLQGKRLAFLGVFLALAMIFSYLEHLLPIPMPIPGFKLGLCNVIVLFVAYRMGLFEGAVLSLARVLLSALLFGSPTGFFFSLMGATLAYGVIILAKRSLSKRVSFVGASVLSASAFNLGQILAACILYSDLTPLGYLPYLLFASAIFGTLTGWLTNLVSSRLEKSGILRG